MQEKLQTWYSNTKEKWYAIEKRQRIKLVAAVLLIIVALCVALFLALRPTMIEIARIDSLADRQVASNVLQAEGIRSRFVGSALHVDERRAEDAVFQITMSEVATRVDTFSLENVFESVGMGTPAGLTRAAINRSHESMLAQMIARKDGVTSAAVLLNLPNENSLWAMNNQQGFASVQVTTYRTLSWREGQAIAALVAGGFITLPIENVTVTDQSLNTLFDGNTHAENARISTIETMERQFADTMVRQIRSYFHQFDSIYVVPNIRMNWDEIIENEIRRQIPEGFEDFPMDREHAIRESIQAMDPASVVGMEANDLITYMTGGTWPMQSNFNEHTRSFTYDVLTRETIRHMGQFMNEESAIAASAYVIITHCEQTMRDAGVIGDGDNAQWANFAEFEMTFNQNPTRELATSTFGEPRASGVFEGMYEGEIRNQLYQDQAADLAAVLGIPVFNLRVFEQNVFIPIEDAPPLNWWLISVLALLFLFILLLAFGLIRRAQPDEVEEIEEPLTVEDMLATTQREEEIERQIEVEKLRAIELGGDSEAKKAIEKFVDERPEAVAGLLRNWLNEEWE